MQGLEERESLYGPPRYITLAGIRSYAVDSMLVKQLHAHRVPEPSQSTQDTAAEAVCRPTNSVTIKQQVSHLLTLSHAVAAA